MTRGLRKWTKLLWLALGLLVGWLLRGLAGDSPGRTSLATVDSAPPSHAAVTAPSPEQRFESLRARLFAAAEAHREITVGVTLEQLAPYLALHERNAESLVAAYCLTKNEALLREALERFPDDPSVLETAYTELKGADRLALAQRLAEVSPDNGFGPLLAAGLLLDAGDRDGAMASLLEAGTRRHVSDHGVVRNAAMREALLGCGFDSAEATLGSLWSAPIIPLYHTTQMTQESVRRTTQAMVEGRTEEASRQAERTLALADRLRGSTAIVHDLIADTMETLTLQALPADTFIGPNGQTAGQRLEALRQDGAMKDFAASDSFLRQSTTASEFEIFAQIRAERGGRAAMDWVRKLRDSKEPR